MSMTLGDLREAVDLAGGRDEIEVRAWLNGDEVGRVPVELQGQAVLLVVERDGSISGLISPADLASEVADDGSVVDFTTGSYRPVEYDDD